MNKHKCPAFELAKERGGLIERHIKAWDIDRYELGGAEMMFISFCPFCGKFLCNDKKNKNP